MTANLIKTYPVTSSPLATSSSPGIVQPDNTTITINGSGVISSTGGLPSGAANEVVATPNGTSGIAALRALVAADVPTSLNTTTFGSDTTIGNISSGGASGIEFLTGTVFLLNTFTAQLKIGHSYGATDAFVLAGWFNEAVGTQLTAASSITMVSPTHHITGATAVATINLPSAANAGVRITLIPDDASGQSWTTGGNIALAGTFTQHKAQMFIWDGTSWYPYV